MSIKNYLKNLNEPFINREISWLAFNERVMQEAEDKNVPLIERLKFLGIFSNNLDEFFRVRVATLKRMVKYKKGKREILGGTPDSILEEIQNIAVLQRRRFEKSVNKIFEEFRKHHIFIPNETELSKEQGRWVRKFFLEKVRPHLIPVMLNKKTEFPQLKDRTIYLAVKLFSKQTEEDKNLYALIELPSEVLPRFVVLPQEVNKTSVMWLDDIIRYNLKEIFYILPHDYAKAYTVKITRDAELDIDNDVSKSVVELISKSVKKRDTGAPVRLLYDEEMPEDLLEFIKAKLEIKKTDNVIAGTRYHNSKDFMTFPDLGKPEFLNKSYPPLLNPYLDNYRSIFSILKERDVLLHFPYESFTHLIDVLREAAIDPKVQSIKITLYRVAKHSTVVNALINAVRNGKDVTVVMELQARFDEESNIYWSNKLIEEGANVIYGVRGLKVHCKLCLITGKEEGELKHYAIVGTGNYNEVTAKVFSDFSLLTSDNRITSEIAKVFEFFNQNYKAGQYEHLIVAPFYMRERFNQMIDNEIENANNGKDAFIYLKLNNLSDKRIINKLYAASNAGVKIRLFIRGNCSIIAGMEGLSENVENSGLIDKFLEHSRVFVFGNGGDPLVYIGSADLMQRNLDYRVEVACPVYDKEIQRTILHILDLESRDNVKSRSLHLDDFNEYRNLPSNALRSQIEIYNYFKKRKI